MKKIVSLALLSLISLVCHAQEVIVLNSDNRILTLYKGGESLKCSVDLEFDSFRYSGDRHFLIFKHIEKQYGIPFYTHFIDLSTAYAQCRKNPKIRLVRESSGDNILDLNAKGQIYLTYLQDMYKTGGNELAVRTSIAVKRLPSLKEIIFPFSIRKHDSESMARQRIDHLDGRISYDSTDIPDDLRVISKDGKYIAPAGIWCGAEAPYKNVWSIDTRKKISAKEMARLKRKNVQCEDLFG
ncbi:hypothetical protein [Variovorax sp. IB41]|uniref:hypothetical protein n=1 Tax=Variovorax sp. IB41 TaxID=2779370 RepID=UPI0018E73A1C|nr:hypothetical protein [Variovorax sp. IB41]MBJ2159558.1 hypothetical protein [Variovorax sp. IB41]